jgi:rhodanese-related sulfurtransferase
MANPYGVPGLSVEEVAEKWANGDAFTLLDVREPVELSYANLGEGVALAPLSALAEQGLEALPEGVRADKEAVIVVMCHTGNRSSQVTAWLRQQGWTNVYNMDGGIEAYAVLVDPSVGRY